MEIQARNQVIRLAWITAASLLGDSFIYLALPLFWQEAGLASLWQVGILLAVNRFVRLPLHPLAGWFYQKVSLPFGLRIAISLAILTTLGCSLVHTFAGWLVFRAMWGVAWTLLRQGSYLGIHEWSAARNQGYLNGLFNGYYRLGSLFGMAVGGLLCEWVAYEHVLQGFALLMVPSFWLIRYSGAKVSDETSTPVQSAHAYRHEANLNGYSKWSIREVSVLLTTLMISLIYQGMLTSTISRLVSIHVGAELQLGTWVLGAGLIAGIVQGLRWGWEPWVAPWIGRKSDQTKNPQLLFAFILIAAACLFVALLAALPVFIWLFVLLGLLLTATLATTLVDALMADNLTVENKHRFLPTFTLATDIGATLGPVVGFLFPEKVLLVGAATLLMGTAAHWLNNHSKTAHTTIIEPSDQ